MTDTSPSPRQSALQELAKFEGDYRNDVQRQLNVLARAVRTLQQQFEKLKDVTMTDLLSESIISNLNATQKLYRAAYDEGVKFATRRYREIIIDLCSALDLLTPNGNVSRGAIEEMIAEAKAVLDGEQEND